MFLCHVMEYIHVHMRGVQYREMMDIDLHVHVLCIHVHIQCIQAQKQNYSPPSSQMRITPLIRQDTIILLLLWPTCNSAQAT